MAKKKTKRRKSAQATEKSPPGPKAGGLFSRKRMIQAGLVAVAGLGGWFFWQSSQADSAFMALAERGQAGLAGWFFWQSSQADSAFMALAERGQAGLSAVKVHRDLGGGHFSPGESGRTGERFPTSGRHHPQWVKTGFHEAPQFAAQLVHALEHGNVVIYYDNPDTGTLETLKDWATLYVGQWSGVVVTPSVGLGKTVVLTAWGKSLRLKLFEPATAAAFIDKYRGRGPENPVR